jgi:putative addiction module component (TIGR02574 family)
MSVLSPPLEKQVLSLPADERLSLIEKLIASLNLPLQAEIDALWATEAEKRIKALDEGQVKAIPGEQVFAELRTKYQQ